MNVKTYFENGFFSAIILEFDDFYRIFKVTPKLPDGSLNYEVGFYFANPQSARQFTERYSAQHSCTFWRHLFEKNFHYSFEFIWSFLSKMSSIGRRKYINGVR